MPQCRDMFGYQFLNGTGTLCWVAGFGEDSQGRPTSSLRKVDVPLVSDKPCEAAMEAAFKARGTNTFKLLPGEICAGGILGKDACVGDGGAPLVCQVWYYIYGFDLAKLYVKKCLRVSNYSYRHIMP